MSDLQTWANGTGSKYTDTNNSKTFIWDGIGRNYRNTYEKHPENFI